MKTSPIPSSDVVENLLLLKQRFKKQSQVSLLLKNYVKIKSIVYADNTSSKGLWKHCSQSMKILNKWKTLWQYKKHNHCFYNSCWHLKYLKTKMGTWVIYLFILTLILLLKIAPNLVILKQKWHLFSTELVGNSSGCEF